MAAFDDDGARAPLCLCCTRAHAHIFWWRMRAPSSQASLQTKTTTDAPPPLDSLDEQVSAVAAKGGAKQPAEEQDDGDDEVSRLPVASWRPIGQPSSANKASAASSVSKPPAKASSGRAALKRGFFDTKKTVHTTAAVPFLRGKQSISSSNIKTSSSSSSGTTTTAAPAPSKKTSIPDFLMLPPDARVAARDKLVSALMPTPDTLAAVQSDPVLKAGFDDPEVMAAVAEVAADPGAVAKYSGNAKVRAFYGAMGALLGGRLEEVGAMVTPASETTDGAAAAAGSKGPAAAAVLREGVREREGDKMTIKWR
jgi:hypothetical protein